jgi:hypothetical protein
VGRVMTGSMGRKAGANGAELLDAIRNVADRHLWARIPWVQGAAATVGGAKTIGMVGGRETSRRRGAS